jgi:hypothetical protein
MSARCNRKVTSIGPGRDVASTGSNRDAACTGSNRDVASTGSNRDVAFTGSNQDVESTGSNQDVASTGSNRDVASTGSNQDVASTGSRKQTETLHLEYDDLRPGAHTYMTLRSSSRGVDASRACTKFTTKTLTSEKHLTISEPNKTWSNGTHTFLTRNNLTSSEDFASEILTNSVNLTSCGVMTRTLTDDRGERREYANLGNGVDEMFDHLNGKHSDTGTDNRCKAIFCLENRDGEVCVVCNKMQCAESLYKSANFDTLEASRHERRAGSEGYGTHTVLYESFFGTGTHEVSPCEGGAAHESDKKKFEDATHRYVNSKDTQPKEHGMDSQICSSEGTTRNYADNKEIQHAYTTCISVNSDRISERQNVRISLKKRKQNHVVDTDPTGTVGVGTVDEQEGQDLSCSSEERDRLRLRHCASATYKKVGIDAHKGDRSEGHSSSYLNETQIQTVADNVQNLVDTDANKEHCYNDNRGASIDKNETQTETHTHTHTQTQTQKYSDSINVSLDSASRDAEKTQNQTQADKTQNLTQADKTQNQTQADKTQNLTQADKTQNLSQTSKVKPEPIG